MERTLTDDLKRVRGKQGILFRLAAAAVEQPDETVRRALFPVVGREARCVTWSARRRRTSWRSPRRCVRCCGGSYSSHYRRMLGPLLAALEFRSNNAAFRPVIDALDLLARYAHVDGKRPLLRPPRRSVPLDGVVPAAWRDAVVDDHGRVERIPYELCVLVALRDAIRRREIYIEGATRWRNPEDDLPGDFEASRDVHYAALRQPLDSSEFIAVVAAADARRAGPARRERWATAAPAGCGSSRGRGDAVDQRAQARGAARAARCSTRSRPRSRGAGAPWICSTC